MAEIANVRADVLEDDANFRRNLEWLVCPVCRSSLELIRVETDDDRSGAASGIRCTRCSRTYLIADGLPVLLAERAGLTSATKVRASYDISPKAIS